MSRQPRLLQSHWRVKATIEEVADILGDVEHLPDWWGAVYLAATVLDPGDSDGLGRRVSFHSRGYLPYTLRWEGVITEANPPETWTIDATGDLLGQGVWTLTQNGDFAQIRYDWQVAVEKPSLRRFGILLWPLFMSNHHWAMHRGQDGLIEEIRRRRG